MLEFAAKLTRSPWLMAKRDVDALREAGFSDLEVLHIVLGTAHFNYFNRVADGVGIALEYEISLPAADSSRQFLLDGAQGKEASPPAGSPRAFRGPEDFFEALGGNPQARELARAWRAYQLKGTRGLEARPRRRMALLASSLDRCPSTGRWYREDLRREAEEPRLLDELEAGRIPEGLPPRDRLLLRHAAKLAREPSSVLESDIAALREAGLDDLAVLQLTMLAAYLSFESRAALGLGAWLEPQGVGP
jgi:alkylhydroperoxidase family enzyme